MRAAPGLALAQCRPDAPGLRLGSGGGRLLMFADPTDALAHVVRVLEELGIPHFVSQALDVAYLRHWAADLSLTDLLERALHDSAIPSYGSQRGRNLPWERTRRTLRANSPLGATTRWLACLPEKNSAAGV